MVKQQQSPSHATSLIREFSNLSGHIVLFGGSFDPPQKAHVELAKLVRDFICPEYVVFVPTGTNPLKPSGPKASENERLAMLEKIVEAETGLYVSDIEFGKIPSYTKDTVTEVRSSLPKDARLSLVIGADVLTSMSQWGDTDIIFSKIDSLIVLPRGEKTNEAIASFCLAHGREAISKLDLRLVNKSCLEISSTEVRDAVCRHDTQELDRLVLPCVREFIFDRGLYPCHCD